jgi:hypothetical protein
MAHRRVREARDRLIAAKPRLPLQAGTNAVFYATTPSEFALRI